MSNASKSPSIDQIRAQFASATQVYWVCPVTKKNIPASDVEAIARHQEKIIREMESKEQAKLRQKSLRDLNAELHRVSSLSELRAWALRRMQLDVGTMQAGDLPAMSMHTPNIKKADLIFSDAYVRLGGGKALTAEVKAALGVKQGKALHPSKVGTGVDNAWFMCISGSSVLGKKILAWTNRKAKKLSFEDKQALLVSNPEHAKDISDLKALGVQIHALREQAAVLTKKCAETRRHALTVLPNDLA